MAWYRKAAFIASRTVSLPRKANDTLLTPPEVFAPGQAFLICRTRFDEFDGVVGVLLDPGADGEDVGVEDDVFGREADLLGQQVDRPVWQMAVLRSAVTACPSSSKAITMAAAP